MATTSGSSVRRLTSTDTIADATHIKGIKIISDGTGTATIRDQSASGSIVWEESTANQSKFEQVDIRASQGVHVTIVATATVYLYLA